MDTSFISARLQTLNTPATVLHSGAYPDGFSDVTVQPRKVP